MSRSRNLLVMCSVLMGCLFAYSASVQLNDPDWYFWFPLYSCACMVNLTNSIISAKLNRQIARLSPWLGVFLFVKVVAEDLGNGAAGSLSLDLSERVVREKTGSLLVIISMILQLRLSSAPDDPSLLVNYGMLFLVFLSCILTLLFFLVTKGETKFSRQQRRSVTT
ncbi:uncharacterized protein LOC129322997 isoform X2 [Prosopis cineraria]|uniref:uncharacterized protein LOC129322997 isoform X2 n=1 Tax=Prosopis cineraria TaxID=364024 RepID=UPI0024108F3F|nr:uncharacterized protein LOC129322997 isoform X2 [Prosopis cineraria]